MVPCMFIVDSQYGRIYIYCQLAIWSHVCLLSTRNVEFAKLSWQIIRLRAQFPYYTIKNVHLDNAGEITSQAPNDYFMFVEINIQYTVADVHTHTNWPR